MSNLKVGDIVYLGAGIGEGICVITGEYLEDGEFFAQTLGREETDLIIVPEDVRTSSVLVAMLGDTVRGYSVIRRAKRKSGRVTDVS